MNSSEPSQMGMKQVHATVHGRVQGVSFRWYTRQQANQLGITGWVRNLTGGRSVQVVAEGTADQLGSLVLFLHEGSPGARVENVDVEWKPATGEFQEFSIRFL